MTKAMFDDWAEQRREKARQGHSLFKNIIFRSPDDLRACLPETAVIETAIHFLKHEPVETARRIEQNGRNTQSDKGAFLAAKWIRK